MAHTAMAVRVQIMELSQAGLTDRQIAERVQVKLRTVRKWRRRAQAQGQAGLVSTMGRPARGALSHFPAALGAQLRQWRQAHPGWGASTLRAELARSGLCGAQALPSRSRIAAFLQQAQGQRPVRRGQPLPAAAARVAQAPHEEWELDARGAERVPEVGIIMLINLVDVYSKVKVHAYPCLVGTTRARRRPTTEDYQLVLRQGFREWGLPDRVAVDHDSIFYDNGSKSPFPTRLHLWLTALGVTLVFGRMAQPTDQATVERSHQTWAHQVLEGQAFAAWPDLYQALERRRPFLNEVLPCRTLNNLPPLVASPAARTPRRSYRPEWEGALLDLTRVWRFLAGGRWFRLASNVGVVSLGAQSYTLGKPSAKQEVEITFDPTDQHFVFRALDGTLIRRRPIKGLTTTALLGEAGPLAGHLPFQLALPFASADWRHLLLLSPPTGARGGVTTL